GWVAIGKQRDEIGIFLRILVNVLMVKSIKKF
nr:hypothetical protein [Tanacetum cinerariifolium]